MKRRRKGGGGGWQQRTAPDCYLVDRSSDRSPHGRHTSGRRSQGWFKHWPAVARLVGSKASIGMRKSAKSLASCRSYSYLSTRTSHRLHGLSLAMCRSSPGESSTQQTQLVFLSESASEQAHSSYSVPLPTLSPIATSYNKVVMKDTGNSRCH